MKKILIIKHGSLGDIIFAIPAINSIRLKFQSSKIDILTESKYINLIKRTNFIDTFFENNRKESFFKTILLLFKLSNIKYDLIIDLQNSNRTTYYNLFFRLFHKAKISSSRPFAHHRYIIPPQGQEKVITGLFNQLKLLNIPKVKNINYDWLKTDLHDVKNMPLALFIPGVSKYGIAKQWQPEKFAEIAKYYQDAGFQICVIGSYDDEKSILPIKKVCKNIINKIGKSPPEIIYSIALKSNIIFTNDTGPGHIAALAKKNIVWLANNNSITESNLPSESHNYKILSNSVKDITTEKVFDFIKKNNLQ